MRRYKKLYEDLLAEYEVLQKVVNDLRGIAREAQRQLGLSPPLRGGQVEATCAEFCNSRGFAAGCYAAPPRAFDGAGPDLCLSPLPTGLGLLVSWPTSICCTNTTDTPCRIVGPGSEESCGDCSQYPPPASWAPNDDLFGPTLPDRTYDEATGKCRRIN